MIITIGGNVGAGKTTLAARLSKALGYEELYMGGLMREVAAEREMTIEEFYTKLKNEPDLEKSIDERQEKLMQTRDNLVVQGRIAWYFAKSSPFKVFNIFLAVDPEVGARRTAERQENIGRDITDILTANTQRAETELQRYSDLYQIENFLDEKNYDYTLDTTRLSEDEVLEKILGQIREVEKLKTS